MDLIHLSVVSLLTVAGFSCNIYSILLLPASITALDNTGSELPSQLHILTRIMTYIMCVLNQLILNHLHSCFWVTH